LPEPVAVRAAREGDLGTLRRLLDQDQAVANARGWLGETPLHAAAGGGSAAVVRLLLEAGAQPQSRRDNGDTPLHRAATGEIAELLIRAARDVTLDQPNEHRQTPLHTACDAGVATVLLRYGASLTERDFQGGTPLHDAGADKARVLIDAGADVRTSNEGGRTPLHNAVWNGDVELVKLLLAAGADATVRDIGGTSPVHLARIRGPQQVRALMETALIRLGRSLTEDADPVTVTSGNQHALHMDPDGRAAFSVAGHATLVRWRLDEPPRPDVVVATEHARIRRLAIHPQRPLIAVAPDRGPVELHRRDDLTSVDILVDLVDVTALAFAPDGNLLAAATSDERVVLVDLATRRLPPRSRVANGPAA
jgi:ankyrin repeat protein